MISRRRWIQGLAASGLLSQIPLLIQNVLANGNKPIAPGMHKLTGNVTVNGQPARIGMLIVAGDTVVTGTDSEAIYVVGQDAFLQRDNSRVVVGGESLKNAMRVLSGKILSVFGKGEKQVAIPTATIGIRGTGCYIETVGELDYFCLCYGQAEVIPQANPGQAEIIETRHHDHPIYIGRDGTKTMVPATVVNHSDDELVLLEALVGRLPPFAGRTGYSY